MKRSIVIFPRFVNEDAIDVVRALYDPLAARIRPHITLVFPFEGELSNEELRLHIQQAIADIPPFRLVLRGVTGHEGGFMFLNVKQGSDWLISLHDRLYTGILSKYLDRTVTFIPHLTVGRLHDKEAFDHAIRDTEGFNEVFATMVRSITVESIDAAQNSHVEFEMDLAQTDLAANM